MEIIVQISSPVARVLHQRAPTTSESKALLKLIETLGLKLEPMHGNTDDPTLQTYFIVEVSDAARAHAVSDRLRQMDDIEAAYVKPPDALP